MGRFWLVSGSFFFSPFFFPSRFPLTGAGSKEGKREKYQNTKEAKSQIPK